MMFSSLRVIGLFKLLSLSLLMDRFKMVVATSTCWTSERPMEASRGGAVVEGESPEKYLWKN